MSHSTEQICPVPILTVGQGNFPWPSRIILSETGSVMGGFGKYEVQETAGRLVLFMKVCQNDSWEPFVISGLTRYYESMGWDPNKMFDGLIGAWLDPHDWGLFPGPYQTEIFLVSLLGGRIAVTEEFVRRCCGENNKNVRS